MAKNTFDYQDLLGDISMGLNLVDHSEFSATIRSISKLAANIVKKTLGPYAHTTIIDDGDFTYPTKDGWTILNRIRFQDPTHNSIFAMLKNISLRIVDKVGDGTTTAMVTADHFLDIVTEQLAPGGELDGYRQVDIVEALNSARDKTIDILKKMAIKIPSKEEGNTTFQEIYDVAYISSNGNENLAKIMQQIYQKTGNPNVLVDMAGGMETTFEIQEGYRLDVNTVMQDRYVNTSEGYYDTGLSDMPMLTVVFDHNVTYAMHARFIEALLMTAHQRHARLMLMAPHFDDLISSAINTRIQEAIKQSSGAIPGVMLVIIPELIRAAQKAAIHDFCVLAGIEMTDSTKIKIFNTMRRNQDLDEKDQAHIPEENLPEYHFGTAQEIVDSCIYRIGQCIIGKHFLTLKECKRDNPLYKATLAQVMESYEAAKKRAANSSTTMLRDLLESEQRLNRLSGALGVIHVGGVSELERHCNKDIVDDTFLACRSAFESGVVPGLNMATIMALIELSESSEISEIERIAVLELADAFKETTMDILRNRYPDDSKQQWHIETQSGAIAADGISSKELFGEILRALSEKRASSFDIVSMKFDHGEIPTVCNSVATDIEILYGITSILGMIMTSDQYLSVSRLYDRTAAMRQQEAQNIKALKTNVNTIINTIDTYLHDQGIEGTAAELIGALCHFDSLIRLDPEK